MSPSTSEPSVSRRGLAALGARAWRRIAVPRTRWTLLLQRESVVAWTSRCGIDGDWPRQFDRFDAWAEQHAGTEVLLLASSGLLHTIQLEGAEPGVSPAQAAARRLLRYHGGEAASWPIAIDADGRFACALHGLEADVLVDAAKRHDIELTGLVPWWSEALRRGDAALDPIRRHSALRFLLVEQTLVTCLDIGKDGLTGVQQRFLDSATPAALDALTERLDDESAAAPETVIAGWGIAGTGGPRFPFGPLAAHPSQAHWLTGERLGVVL